MLLGNGVMCSGTKCSWRIVGIFSIFLFVFCFHCGWPTVSYILLVTFILKALYIFSVLCFLPPIHFLFSLAVQSRIRVSMYLGLGLKSQCSWGLCRYELLHLTGPLFLVITFVHSLCSYYYRKRLGMLRSKVCHWLRVPIAVIQWPKQLKEERVFSTLQLSGHKCPLSN